MFLQVPHYFEDFAIEERAKDGLKMGCENGKLFLRKP